MFLEMAQALSPEQVRLVLRRAAELERRPETVEDEGELDVNEIAAEVGIAPEAVRTALAEVRAGVVGSPVADRSFLDRLVGPAEIVLSRTVPGPIADVRGEIERFLRGQLLEIRRNFGDRGQVWGPAWDVWSRIKRVFDITQEIVLEKGSEVTVVLVPRGENEVQVRISVRLEEPRRGRAWNVAAWTAMGVGVAAGGIALFGTAPLEIASVAAGSAAAAGSWATARSGQRKDLARAESAILRLLDRLEHERPPR
jgi:hypothetical protein